MMTAHKGTRTRPINDEDAPLYIRDGWSVPDYDPPKEVEPEDAPDLDPEDDDAE